MPLPQYVSTLLEQVTSADSPTAGLTHEAASGGGKIKSISWFLHNNFIAESIYGTRIANE